MGSRYVRRVRSWFLVAVGICTILSGMAVAEAEAIKVQSVRGVGESANEASLLIDGRMPPEEASFDDPNCVYWNGEQTHFIFDLGKPFQVTGLTLQADNNDDYIVEAGSDGQTWTALVTIPGEVGEIDFGMDTLSTVAGEPESVASLTVTPAEVRYLKLSARGGDDAYAVSELIVYGKPVQTQEASQTHAVVTPAPEGTAPVAAPTPIDPKKPLKAKSVKGFGEFSHAAKLLIDKKMPKEGTDYDNRACVFWSDPQTYFVIDMGEVLWITGLTIQVDNNDDYVIEVSLDGKQFRPLLTISAEWGQINDGMDTLSTLAKAPGYTPAMRLVPAQAQYIKFIAKEGDEAYSASELLVYGSKTAPVMTAPQPEGVPTVAVGGEGDMESVFNAMDTNKDGKVSKEEYAAIWKDKLDVDKNFAFFDKDGNGYIEKAEFMSLRDGLKEETSQDQTAQTEEAEEGSTQLDPVLVRKAIDALPKWAQINELMEAQKPLEADKVVKDLGFENWLVLNYYFNMIRTIGLSVEENPQTKNVFAPTFGQEAVDLIAKPETLARVKQYAPK